MTAVKIVQRCMLRTGGDFSMFKVMDVSQKRCLSSLVCSQSKLWKRRRGCTSRLNIEHWPPSVICNRFLCSVVGTDSCKEMKKELDVHHDGRSINIVWSDGSQSRFHSIWLRNCCHCPDCKQDHSGQRLIDVGAINPDIKISHVHDAGDGTLCIKWENDNDDNHIGVIPLDFLKQHDYCHLVNDKTTKLGLSVTKDIPEYSFSDMTSSKAGVLRWMREINEHGLCMLRNVPTEDGMVAKVAEHIAPVQHSIYGTIFDVCIVPNPINVAYSSVGLDFHMDLIYYESAPGLQLLHCMKFDECVDGGESVFVDSFHIAEVFRDEHPEEFETLTKIPATFQKIHYAREYPVHMTYQKPHISLNHRDEIVSVNWAPAFEGPLAVRPEDVEPYYRAYHKFAAAIKNSPAIMEIKMKEGDLVTFNNRRILHGRKPIKPNGGTRVLQGCYVNIDDYKSQLYVLSHLLRDQRPIQRVGNQCWF